MLSNAVFFAGGLEVSFEDDTFLFAADDDVECVHVYLHKKNARQLANAVLAWAGREETPGG